ncbi:hypothetical protein GQ457_03G003630 [Hibiscus cannabinus]
MQTPMDTGGFGFCDLEKYNLAFLMKFGYQLIIEEDKLWVRVVVQEKYNWEGVLPLTLESRNCLRLWSGISRVWENLRNRVVWSVRDGCIIDFWYDDWLVATDPLALKIPMNLLPAPCPVASFVTPTRQWDIDALLQVPPKVYIQQILTVFPPSSHLGPDWIGWKGDAKLRLTVKSTYGVRMSDTGSLVVCLIKNLITHM